MIQAAGLMLLMTPGPTRVPERVPAAGATPMIHHRSPECSRVLSAMLQELGPVFGTREVANVGIRLEGRARRLGDNVNTDDIISPRRKRDTLDESQLKRYLLEGIDPGFAASVQPGDILVAGRNFGCGSIMEVAATVILAAGIRAVLAESFSRTFFRNAINNGLLPAACDTSGIREGDRLTVELDRGVLVVGNGRTCTRDSTAAGMPDRVLEILESGGLVPYLRKRGSEPEVS